MKRIPAIGLRLVQMMLPLLAAGVQAEETPGLERLFTTVIERQQIDLERQRFLAGEENEEGDSTVLAPVRDPDIHFQAALFPAEGKPLLWINDRKGTLAQWRHDRDRLVVQQLWLEGQGTRARLRILLDNRTYVLQLNDVLNRYSQQVTPVYKYVPVPAEEIPSLIGTLEQQSSQSAAGGSEPTAGRVLMDKATQLRQRNDNLDTMAGQ